MNLFNEFYAKLNNIVNSKFNLRKKLKDMWIVKKILGSILERFWPKVTAIKESKDLYTYMLNNL
jgi:hypothetical protein